MSVGSLTPLSNYSSTSSTGSSSGSSSSSSSSSGYTDPFSSSSSTLASAGSNIAAQISLRAQSDLKKKLATLQDSYSTQLDDIGSQVGKLQTVQQGISDAITSLNSAKSSLSGLSNVLDNLTTLLKSSPSANDVRSAIIQYQTQIMTINSMTSDSDSLLSGGYKAVTYEYDTSGRSETVRGDFMGARYTITASDNNVWVPDGNGTSILAYNKYPDTTKTVNSSSVFGGTTLNSQSGSTITFTIHDGTATPQTLTGTLKVEGLGLKDAWMYNNFTTAAGLAAAKADLASAKSAVQAEQLRYDSAISTAKYRSNKIDLAVENLNNQQQALTDEEGKKASELKDKSQQQQAALTMAFSAQASAGASLLGVLGGESTSVIGTGSSDTPLFDIFA